MKKSAFALMLLMFSPCFRANASSEDPRIPFYYKDALAPRDSWGKLHQNPVVLPTDFEKRYSVRFHYYFRGARSLANDPAYVAAAQTALRRLGYYCGETDGVFSPEVSDAIARLQKNYSLRVNGNLDVGVRRALYLP
jgi:hypothetical protein